MSQRSRANPWFRAPGERHARACHEFDEAQGHEFAVMSSPSPRGTLEAVWVREMEAKRRVERADLERVLYRSEGER